MKAQLISRISRWYLVCVILFYFAVGLLIAFGSTCWWPNSFVCLANSAAGDLTIQSGIIPRRWLLNPSWLSSQGGMSIVFWRTGDYPSGLDGVALVIGLVSIIALLLIQKNRRWILWWYTLTGLSTVVYLDNWVYGWVGSAPSLFPGWYIGLSVLVLQWASVFSLHHGLKTLQQQSQT